MSRASLREFISSVLVRKRLRFGDLRRLQRDVLPTGIATREEAEALITLDQALSKADVDWPAYLITAVRDFVVSTSNPAGCVDGETAAWLVSQLSSSATSRAARTDGAAPHDGTERDRDHPAGHGSTVARACGRGERAGSRASAGDACPRGGGPHHPRGSDEGVGLGASRAAGPAGARDRGGPSAAGRSGARRPLAARAAEERSGRGTPRPHR